MIQTWDTQLKGDNSPLTRADLSANEVICSKLQERYPDIPMYVPRQLREVS
jgi:3'(2'), 5'-bisphosphate nucleotidase